MTWRKVNTSSGPSKSYTLIGWIAFGLSVVSPFSWTAGIAGVGLAVFMLGKLSRTSSSNRGRKIAWVAIVWAVVSAFLGKQVCMYDWHRTGSWVDTHCAGHLRFFDMAVQANAFDNGFRLPDGASWSGQLFGSEFAQSFGVTGKDFCCPWKIMVPHHAAYPIESYLYWRYRNKVRPVGLCDYAMNESVAGSPIGALPSDIVIFFEALPGWNRVGGPTIAVMNYHKKGRGCHVLLRNGTVRFIRTKEELMSLRWK